MTRRNVGGTPVSQVGIQCVPLGMDWFKAEGKEAIQIQEGMIRYVNKMWTIRTVSSYATSVAFSVIGAALIIYAPESRGLAATIVAAGLFAMALGIAGYTHFSARFPGVRIEGQQRRASS